MPDFAFYQTEYHGRRITDETDFTAALARANAKLAWYESTYTVIYLTMHSRKFTLCALADEYQLLEQALGLGGELAPRAQSIGSESTSYNVAGADGIIQNEEKRLMAALRLYATVYRGKG